MAAEKAAMRAYVTGADHLQYSWLGDGWVQVNVTHSNLKQYVMELRLNLSSKIGDIKRKLLTHNGTSTEYMKLILQDEAGNNIVEMADDDRPLGFYSVRNGQTIHVVDTDPFSLSRDGGLDDVSKIQKYRMTDEDYDKRENTLRAYKRKMLEKDPNFRFFPKKPSETTIDYTDPSCVGYIKLGERCQILLGGRRGVVAFIGEIPALAAGFWVGVRLDEPLGKGDGSKGGVKYFEADDKYGSFVRPDHLEVGDFPPEDDFGDCGCGEEHAPAAVESKEAESKEAKAADSKESKATESKVSSAVPKQIGGMTRVGGRRADEEDDDDDEL